MRVHLVMLLVSLTALPAIGSEQAPSGIGPHTPPPEAISACNNKHEGDSVSFATTRGETVTGKCKLLKTQLVAIPDHPPQRGDGDRRPPQ